MSARNKYLISTSVIMIVAVAMFFESFNIHGVANQMTASLGPGFFPMLTTGCMIVLCCIKFYQIITNKSEEYTKKVVDTKEKTKWSENKVLFVFLAIMVYAAVFETLGFFVSSVILLFFLFWLLSAKEKRNYILFTVISTVTAGIIYCLFVYGFQLMLPAGILDIL